MQEKFDYGEYLDFMKSEDWKKTKNDLIAQIGLTCENCGKTFPRRELDLHHLDYDKEFGTENEKDLMLLCKECHHEKEQDLEFFEPTPKPGMQCQNCGAKLTKDDSCICGLKKSKESND